MVTAFWMSAGLPFFTSIVLLYGIPYVSQSARHPRTRYSFTSLFNICPYARDVPFAMCYGQTTEEIVAAKTSRKERLAEEGHCFLLRLTLERFLHGKANPTRASEHKCALLWGVLS